MGGTARVSRSTTWGFGPALLRGHKSEETRHKRQPQSLARRKKKKKGTFPREQSLSLSSATMAAAGSFGVKSERQHQMTRELGSSHLVHLQTPPSWNLQLYSRVCQGSRSRQNVKHPAQCPKTSNSRDGERTVNAGPVCTSTAHTRTPAQRFCSFLSPLRFSSVRCGDTGPAPGRRSERKRKKKRHDTTRQDTHRATGAEVEREKNEQRHDEQKGFRADIGRHLGYNLAAIRATKNICFGRGKA